MVAGGLAGVWWGLRGDGLAGVVPDVAGPDVAVHSGVDGRVGAVVAAVREVEGRDPVVGDDDVGGDGAAGVEAAVDGVVAAGDEDAGDGDVELGAEVLEQGDGVG